MMMLEIYSSLCVCTTQLSLNSINYKVTLYMQLDTIALYVIIVYLDDLII
jgi:hypothetical protein